MTKGVTNEVTKGVTNEVTKGVTNEVTRGPIVPPNRIAVFRASRGNSRGPFAISPKRLAEKLTADSGRKRAIGPPGLFSVADYPPKTPFSPLGALPVECF